MPPYFWILFAIVAAILSICALYFSPESVVKRKLRNSEHRKISGFKEGDTARISGKIQHLGKTLQAPLSGRKCSYYYVLVEEKIGSRNTYWSKLIEEEVFGDIIIYDGSDYAVIQTRKIKSYVVQDANFSSGFLDDPTNTLKAYLEKHRKESEDLLGMNKRIRYKEGVLEENETLTVVGKGRWLQKHQFRLNIPAEKVLFIGNDENEPVYFTDDIM